MLDPVRQSIELLLKMIRNSADPITVTCNDGTYQHTLDGAQNIQLIRVSLPADSPYYAEISGNRHRYNIRLLRSADGRSQLADQSVSFQITCCCL